MSTQNGATSSRELVLDELRDGERFVLVTHEHPDGDALGSLAAMQQVLGALGKDAVSFMAADEFPLPYEYRFLDLPQLVTSVPDDVDDRTRDLPGLRQHRPQPGRGAQARRARILNIDHHHDNTRFGTVDHVVPEASCTAEVVWDLMQRARRRADAADRRGALRRAGHRHRQVHVREHRLARARDGGRPDRRRGRRARDLPAPLRGRAAGQARAARARAQRRRALRRRAADADPAHARGLRASPAPRRATPRASSTTCARSRAPRSRGSCASCCPTPRATRAQGLAARDRRPRRRLGDRPRAAAAAGTAARPASRPTWSRRARRVPARAARRAALGSSEPADGVLLVDKPAGVTSHDVVAAERRRLPRGDEGRARRHARPVRDRAAARAGRARDARAALPDGAAQALRDGRAAGLHVDDRRRRGRDRARPHAGRAARAADRAASASARRRTPRCASAASARTRWRARGEAVEVPEREVEVHALRAAAGATASGRRSRSSAARAPTCARWSPTSATRTASSCGAPASARSTSPTPGASSALADALGFLPGGRAGGRRRRAGRRTASRFRPARRAADTVRLLDADGLIALAEPRGDGTLKPVVGFRG